MTRQISVCLLSGGIDSTVAAVQAAEDSDRLVYLLSIFYGQGAEAAERIHAPGIADWLMAKYHNVREHFILEIGGRSRVSRDGSSGREPSWAEGFVGWRSPRQGWELAGYPSTRDEVFTLIAAAGAEARLRDNPDAAEADVVLATNADDLGNFSDLKASNFTTHLQSILDGKLVPQQGRAVRVRLPLIELSKPDVIRLGLRLGAPLEMTWSCYFGEPSRPCGQCDQCEWRAAAFAEAGLEGA